MCYGSKNEEKKHENYDDETSNCEYEPRKESGKYFNGFYYNSE